jgi:hypothetical protein
VFLFGLCVSLIEVHMFGLCSVFVSVYVLV